MNQTLVVSSNNFYKSYFTDLIYFLSSIIFLKNLSSVETHWGKQYRQRYWKKEAFEGLEHIKSICDQ